MVNTLEERSDEAKRSRNVHEEASLALQIFAVYFRDSGIDLS